MSSKTPKIVKDDDWSYGDVVLDLEKGTFNTKTYDDRITLAPCSMSFITSEFRMLRMLVLFITSFLVVNGYSDRPELAIVLWGASLFSIFWEKLMNVAAVMSCRALGMDRQMDFYGVGEYFKLTTLVTGVSAIIFSSRGLEYFLLGVLAGDILGALSVPFIVKLDEKLVSHLPKKTYENLVNRHIKRIGESEWHVEMKIRGESNAGKSRFVLPLYEINPVEFTFHPKDNIKTVRSIRTNYEEYYKGKFVSPANAYFLDFELKKPMKNDEEIIVKNKLRCD